MNVNIKNLLQQGFTLVTSTNRLSQYFHSRYAIAQHESGLKVWETPDILPWQAWSRRCLENYSLQGNYNKQVLNVNQQQMLWYQIVTSSTYSRIILLPSSTARLASQAWNQLHEWNLWPYPEKQYTTDDTDAFISWAMDYQDLCNKNNWVDEARVITEYISLIQNTGYSPAYRIALVGMSEKTPQQEAFISCLRDSGSNIIEIELEKSNKTISFGSYLDSREELIAVANWASDILEKNNQDSIGIVVPNLAHLRNDIESCFEDVMFPGVELSGQPEIPRPFTIAIGKPLNEYALINAALSILGLDFDHESIKNLGHVIRSQYLISADNEKFCRAQLDAYLYKNNDTSIHWTTLISVIENATGKPYYCPVFLSILRKWQEYIQSLPARQKISNWAECFTSILSIFGWPGERKLTSSEYQTAEAWQMTMGKLASLELVTSSLSFSAALAMLKQVISQQSFQPETAEVPVQILGITGAAEMQFKHLWIMGLHEEVWPQPVQANPFIPVKLQQQYKMPGTSAEVALDYAKNITEKLLNSAEHVVISVPLNEKERDLRPSPLLKEFLANNPEPEVIIRPVYIRQIHATQSLEKIIDNKALPLATAEYVRGGVSMFKDQSMCPFRGYARHRLHAAGFADVDIGLSAMERGSLIHTILQSIWLEIKTHQNLVGMKDNKLTGLVERIVKEEVTHRAINKPNTYTERFQTIEMNRLTNLVNEWMQMEKLRAPFSVIACEIEREFNFSDLTFNARIDRIDKTDKDEVIIIDYKTGQVRISDWFTERPDDPQLPLYAIINDEVSCISYAEVKRNKIRFTGLSASNEILPGIKSLADSRYVTKTTSDASDLSTWEKQLEQWREILAALVKEFREGHAAVDPKNANSCRYCDLHAFCRIHEKNKLTADIN